jgi:hypothetical protein
VFWKAFGESEVVSTLGGKMASKKNDLIAEPMTKGFPPMDFYRFKHMTWQHRPVTHMVTWKAPYWIVGVSPFDEKTVEEDGYVTHLGSPRFVARWTMDESKFHLGNNQRHFFDDDHGLLVYEISLLDEFTRDSDAWLFEAACAVAFSKGLICAMDAIDEQI